MIPDAFLDAMRDMVPRQPPLVACVALFGVFVTVLVGWSAFLLGRYGGPHRWPPVPALSIALVALVGSVCWLWIDGPVEGRVLVQFTETSGLSEGDVLASPALIFAAIVIAGQLRYRSAARAGRGSASP